MKIQNNTTGTDNRRIFSIAAGLRHSRHFSALSEFYLTIKRGDAKQLLVTFLLALMLLVPIGTLILAEGLEKASANLKAASRISVFLATGTTQPIARELATTLTNNERIDKVTLVSAENINLTQPAPTTVTPPIPALLEVVPSARLAKEPVIELADQLQSLSGIDFVHLNQARLEKNESAFHLLNTLAKFATIAALAIAGLFTLLVSRQDIINNEKSISLMKQMGATRPDIRRPFVYRCLLLGILAGALSLATAMVILGIALHFADLRMYSALIPDSPSLIHLALFFTIVIFAAGTATTKAFTKL